MYHLFLEFTAEDVVESLSRYNKPRWIFKISESTRRLQTTIIRHLGRLSWGLPKRDWIVSRLAFLYAALFLPAVTAPCHVRRCNDIAFSALLQPSLVRDFFAH
jgi:hypothetical protein